MTKTLVPRIVLVVHRLAEESSPINQTWKARLPLCDWALDRVDAKRRVWPPALSSRSSGSSRGLFYVGPGDMRSYISRIRLVSLVPVRHRQEEQVYRAPPPVNVLAWRRLMAAVFPVARAGTRRLRRGCSNSSIRSAQAQPLSGPEPVPGAGQTRDRQGNDGPVNRAGLLRAAAVSRGRGQAPWRCMVMTSRRRLQSRMGSLPQCGTRCPGARSDWNSGLNNRGGYSDDVVLRLLAAAFPLRVLGPLARAGCSR